MKKVLFLIIISFLALNMFARNKKTCKNWKENKVYCQEILKLCKEEFDDNWTEILLSLGCKKVVCAANPKTCSIWKSRKMRLK